MKKNSLQHLRKIESGRQQKWSIEEIQAGLEYFKTLHNHYPTSKEIDEFEYLPSSRSIQRSLGGLKNLRTILALDEADIDYTSGLRRSELASKIYEDAVSYEEAFYAYLLTQFNEIAIHEHKILRPGHVCCDFFIYLPDNRGIAIDLFYAKDIHSVKAIINIKEKRYSLVNYQTYLILMNNPEINQSRIDHAMQMKKNILPKHIVVLTEAEFKANLNKYINS